MAVSFLKAVAEAYVAHHEDLSRILFVFPNRRAGTFFLKHMSEAAGTRPVLLPQVTTMSDFVEEVSGKVVAGRIELLFILYKSYCNLLRENGVKTMPEFDSFRRWGETALSDFNEVDMQDADADSLFKNVRDLKEISSNFLTEEQLKVMNEFFGQAYDPESLAAGFWKKFNGNEDSELHSKFRMLWQVLGPLYRIFRQELDARGLSSPGGTYRAAADILEKGLPSSIDAEKIVMIGFNALTSSERRIFDSLATYEDETSGSPYAEFFWDAAGPVISDKSSAAGRYVNYNKSRWPSPGWAAPYMAKSDVSDMPGDIKVIAVPSNSMQTKVVAEQLASMKVRLPDSDFDDARVAVVLPDEGLLIPMLYSLPEEISDVNLTMGYPMRLSAVYTFVSLLRRLQSSRRKSGASTGYYYKDLNMLLSHPFSRVLFGHAVTEVKEWIQRHHRYIIDIADVRDMSAEMARLLRPLPDDSGARATAEWLDSVLESIGRAVSDDSARILKDNVDAANIAVYRVALATMLDSVEEYGIDMQWRTFLTLTDRLLSGETVNFEGQPLRGLQVMGILETRALDFERIIIPSLNERILPARKRTRTFISDSLRKAYGLPPTNYAESLFAYYFYRMIARAKEVVLLYDSRSSDGARSGDVSRYVLQLKYLYAPTQLHAESRSFAMSKSELAPTPVAKTPEILDILSSYMDPGKGGSNLSATALTKYAGCQLKFYYEHILRIKTDEEAADYMDAITQGSIVHDVMEQLYLPPEMRNIYLEHPQVIDAGVIQSRLRDVATIDRLVRRAVNKRFFHLADKDLDRPLRGSSAHVAKILRSQVLGILRFDLSQAPFFLYGVEIDGNVSVKMKDGRLVNMRYAIDRLDRPLVIIDGAEREYMRIVDYKTGSIHAEADTMESVFNGDYKSRNLLQLWLYANIFDALPQKNFDKKGPRPVLDLFSADSALPKEPFILELYDISFISGGKHVYPKVEGAVQSTHVEQNARYLQLLEQTLEGLFDPEVPFKPASDEQTCRICPFKTICWR